MFEKEKLQEIVGKKNVLDMEPLKKHTTFKIGGPAKYFISPETVEDLAEVVSYARKEKEKFFILGNGSNILVSDDGYDGMIISTHVTGKNYCESDKKMSICSMEVFERQKMIEFLSDDKAKKVVEKFEGDSDDFVVAGAGIMLSTLANTVAKMGLSGFEFAAGIPGTLGGAVTMNAGAYGGEIKNSIVGAMVLDKDNNTLFLSRDEMDLGYRKSIIQKEKYIVLYAVFAFVRGDAQKIMAQIKDLNAKRREKQPLEYGSAGSTFKRPEGYFAGKLIEDSGLKGYRVGDIMVSDKHCGFVVNVGEGTYGEAMELIENVKNTVKEKFDVDLELEVKLLK